MEVVTDFLFLGSKITVDGNEIYGYIPKTFTVEVLSENQDGKEFVIRKIDKATLYLSPLTLGRSLEWISERAEPGRDPPAGTRFIPEKERTSFRL